ncbi:hypothetical protein B296_00002275 [Ensete ventricosum]|uniref:Uncharacterized protein n=1 Tax=Ensete ventricosum TaxID=4639 RepID=A0A427AJV7_ENSVE|nr:hypothetical protein B296_00002275 [Ensete ventricosum]
MQYNGIIGLSTPKESQPRDKRSKDATALQLDRRNLLLPNPRRTINQDVRRTRTTPRIAYRPPTLSTSSHPSQPKKLTREELHDRSTKGLCWHCDESWSCDHHCKRGQLLLIEPIIDLEHEEEDHEEEVTKEDPQLAECMVHALVCYVNP